MAIKKYISLSLILALSFSGSFVNGQNVGTQTNKSQILIGERVQYDLLIRLPSLGYMIDIDLPDSIAHFELIARSDFDTTVNNDGYSLHQAFTFTSFDSGQWYIPSFPVVIQKGNMLNKFITDSAIVNVGYSPADSTGQLRDIKPVMDVEIEDYFWWYVAAGILLLLIIVLLIYWYIKKQRNKPVPVLHSPLTPYSEAMKELDALSGLNLSAPAELKQYHSGLSFIIKRYYSRISQVNLLDKTTGDFLMKLKAEPQEPDFVSSLAGALRTGDAVKFAKFIPGIGESKACLEEIKKAIEALNSKK